MIITTYCQVYETVTKLKPQLSKMVEKVPKLSQVNFYEDFNVLSGKFVTMLNIRKLTL